MSSRIQFYPVYGCNPFEQRCFVLKIDEFRLLLDCGWNSKFEEADIEGLKSVDLASIDAVLLSQPDLAHLGALPYAYSKMGLNAPIFATAPIWRMGQYMVMDAFVAAHQTHANFDLFTHEDIKKVFKQKFKSKLKYSQEYPLIKEIQISPETQPPNTDNNNSAVSNTKNGSNTDAESQQALVRRIGNSNTILSSKTDNNMNTVSLTITPYSAGHMVGGTIWRISKDTDSIIYAVDYNIRREKHLNESVFGILEIRPSLLITDCINIGHSFTVKRKIRENQLYSTCMQTLRNGGNVLIPSDSSGRCLEILYSLYSSFAKHKDFQNYSLVFLSYTSKNTLNSAKSMLEWMCDSCQKELNKNQKNVFDFKELLVCQTMQDFKACIKGAYVCIASNEFLDSGFSLDLFQTLSQHTANTVLLTQRAAPTTLVGKLLDIIYKGGSAANRTVEFVKYQKERLTDKEQVEYLEKLKQQEVEQKEREKQQRQDAIAFSSNAERKSMEMDGDDEPDIHAVEVDGGDDGEVHESFNKISKSKKRTHSQAQAQSHSMDVDAMDSMDVVFDPSLNKRIKLTSAYDMYPFHGHEQELVLTDYGLEVDLDEWRDDSSKRKKKKLAEQPEQDEFESMSKSHSLSPSPNDIVNQTMALLPADVLHPNPKEPFKTVKEKKKLFVKCQLKFLNVEGRSDEESIKQTLPTLQPRQMILVHGDLYQKQQFKQFCVQERICSDVMIAENLQWTKVKTNTKYKKIIMDDVIERSLGFYNIGGYEVAYLKGRLSEINKEEMDIDIGDVKNKSMIDDIQYKLRKSSKTAENEADDMDDLMMDETAEDINRMNINYPANDGHSLSYLGDATKIEMETSLKQGNIPAELYYGGTLVAGRNGEVRVAHKNAQKTVLSIDATLTGDYFDIRDKIESQYHLI